MGSAHKRGVGGMDALAGFDLLLTQGGFAAITIDDMEIASMT